MRTSTHMSRSDKMRAPTSTGRSRSPRGWLRAALVLVWLLGVQLATEGHTIPATPAHAAGDCASSPEINLFSFDLRAVPLAQECALIDLENNAYDQYAFAHGMTPGDPRIEIAGQYDIPGLAWQFLQASAAVVTGTPGDATPDQVAAYAFLQSLVQHFNENAAQKALDEYNNWASDACHYLPPPNHPPYNSASNPPVKSPFDFYGGDSAACAPTEESLFQGPTPPSYEQFLQYGQFAAERDVSFTLTPSWAKYQNIVSESLVESTSSWSALILGGVPQAGLFPSTATNYLFPYAKEAAERLARQNSAIRASNAETQKLIDLQKQTQLAEDGAPDDTVLDEPASLGDDLLLEETIDGPESLAEFGADALTGPFIVAGFAIALITQEAQAIIAQQQIKPKLQANLTASQATPDVESMLADTTGGGQQLVLQIFENNLNISNPNFGTGTQVLRSFSRRAHITSGIYDTPPSDGTQFEVELFRDGDTTAAYTSFSPTAYIDTWPLGVDQGSRGVEFVQIGVSNGMLWHEANLDEQAAGLQGFLPSGEIHYFDWSGHPRIAFIDGNQFLTITSPGSADIGGLDAGDACASSSECTLTPGLDVLGPGGKAQPGYTYTEPSNAGLTDTTFYVPSTGAITPTPGQRERLVIKPDPGATPAINIFNQYGNYANSRTDGYPDGGLMAGQTVQLTDQLDNPLGYPETYTWQVETKCPYDASNPPKTIDGVPVCSNSPDYNNSSLASNESDLYSGCPSACTEDPAFHNDPVATFTGQTVPFTWPGPGTYRVRLITTDAYGVTKQMDEDETIVGTAPSIPLTTSPPLNLSAFGPIHTGTSTTMTGCIETDTGVYAHPSVTINWGDDTVDTQTDPGSSGPLSITYDPSAACGSYWTFTDSHTYNLPNPNNAFTFQVPVGVSVSDGFGLSRSIQLGANITFDSAPTITSPNSGTWMVGRSSDFTVTTSGIPVPTLSISNGSVPSGMDFEQKAGGTAIIGGDPSPADEGVHTFDIQAHNSDGTATQTFTMTVDNPPSFTSGSSSALTAGQTGSASITTAGYPTAAISVVSVSGPNGATALPAGLTFHDNTDGTATIAEDSSGATTGTYALKLKATSAAGTAFQDYSLVLSSAPKITVPTTPPWTTGFSTQSTSSFTIGTTGYPAPGLAIVSGTLPNGLNFQNLGNGTALIYGKPTVDGTVSVDIKASNIAGSDTQTLVINTSASGGPAISFSGGTWSTTDGVAYFTEGTGGSLTITSSDGTSTPIVTSAAAFSSSGTCPASSDSSVLPSGLSYAGGSGGTATISGTPNSGTTDDYDMVVCVSGSGPSFLRIAVLGAPVFTSPSNATFVVGSPGSFTVSTRAIPRAAFVETDALPAGLSFQDNGDGTATISGTPQAGTDGTSTIDIAAENLETLDSSDFTHQTLTITVDDAPAFTSPATAYFGEGAASSFYINTTGFPVAGLTESGSLPSGLTFTDNGDGTATLTGTPATGTSGDYPLTITADSAAGTATQDLDVQVGLLPTVTSSLDALFNVGQSSSFDVITNGSPTPTVSTTTALPSGLTLQDNGDGTATVAGTPDAGTGGAYAIPITVSNQYGSTNAVVNLAVDETPSFKGTAVTNCSDATSGENTATFTVGEPLPFSWTLCTSGFPPASLSLEGALPAGVSFVDNGDGSATISGSPDPGSAGIYDLTLDMTNETTGTPVQQSLQLDVNGIVQSTSFPDNSTFIAGEPNTYTIRATGAPTPTMTLFGGSTLPDWLTLTDNGDGTATLSGTPPLNAVGNEIDFTVIESNGVGNGLIFEPAAVTVAQPNPPDGTVGDVYDYSFTDPGATVLALRRPAMHLDASCTATYTLADGDTLPPGMSMSTCGELTGTPETPGTYTFSIVVTDGAVTSTIGPITYTVAAAHHELEIGQFRLIGQTGNSDWFATVYNPNAFDVSLTGWSLGTIPLYPTKDSHGNPIPTKISLGTGDLAPGASIVVTGPYSSLSNPDIIGPGFLSDPGGFQIVAPDGTIVDQAGEIGANPSVVSGPEPTPGVTPPTGADMVAEKAFTRILNGSVPQDTDDNAVDFSYTAVTEPTAAPISVVHATRSGHALTVTWKVANVMGLVGFTVHAGTHQLNTRPIPVHTSARYRVTFKHAPRGHVSVLAIKAVGGVVTAQSHRRP
jgi:hypothetical protein